jgi:hypothetical protein
MGTKSILHLRHDCSGVIADDEIGFVKALLAYLRNPTRANADELIPYGIVVESERGKRTDPWLEGLAKVVREQNKDRQS